MKRILIALGLAALLVLIAPRSHGAPPEGSDGRLSEFFLSLKQPGSQVSCCSISDCRFIDAARISAQGWEAKVGDDWIPIPPERIIRDRQNIDGRAVLCYLGGRVLCFLEPTMT